MASQQNLVLVTLQGIRNSPKWSVMRVKHERVNFVGAEHAEIQRIDETLFFFFFFTEIQNISKIYTKYIADELK